MTLHVSDGSVVGTLTDGSGTLVTRPTLVTGSTKQCSGGHATDGSRYMCFASAGGGSEETRVTDAAETRITDSGDERIIDS